MHGPFTFEELKSLEIGPTTKIWYKDLKEWTAISSTPLYTSLFPESVNTSEMQAENGSTVPNAGQCITPEVQAVDGTETGTTQIENPQENDGATTTPPVFIREDYLARQYQENRQSGTYNAVYFNDGGLSEAYKQGYRKGLQEGMKLDKETDTSKCPPTNLVWAILSTILCCLPIGIVAIVYASKVTGHFYRNEYLKAKKASDRAMYWSLASLITWMVTQPILTALSFLSGSF